MIKFFRKTRYDLMEKNKTGKYFKYAIGEIVLVVIGILIALSINNWNERRKGNIRLNAGLQALKLELLADVERINSQQFALKDADAYGQYLQDFVNHELNKIDTIKLRKAIHYTGYLLVIKKTNSAYENLVNQGDIQNISNTKLRQDLANFYDENNLQSTYHNNIILGSFQEYLSYIHKFTKAGTIRSFYEAEIANSGSQNLTGEKISELKANNGSLVNWSTLKNDSEFKILIDKVQTNRFIQIVIYGRATKFDIDNLVKMIDNELEKSL